MERRKWHNLTMTTECFIAMTFFFLYVKFYAYRCRYAISYSVWQSGTFSRLRQIRSVRRSLSKDTLLTLLRALVVSKVDCCSTVLACLDRLQSVLNAAARLVFSARRSEHVTPLLGDLHWLKVPERIKFRLCVLTHHAKKCSATYNVPAPPHNRTV